MTRYDMVQLNAIHLCPPYPQYNRTVVRPKAPVRKHTLHINKKWHLQK